MNRYFDMKLNKVFQMKQVNEKCKKSRRCNICAEHFRPKMRFDRYCRHCKEESDHLKFRNWLPERDDQSARQLS